MCGRFANDAKVDELIQEFVAEGNDYRDWGRSSRSRRPRWCRSSASASINDTGEVTRVGRAGGVGLPSRLHEGVEAAPVQRPHRDRRHQRHVEGRVRRRRAASCRCAATTSGRASRAHKQAHFLHGEQPLLAAAGISTARKVDDEWEVSTAIITREARDASGEVHDRMPVFLEPDVSTSGSRPRSSTTTASSEMVPLLTRCPTEGRVHIIELRGRSAGQQLAHGRPRRPDADRAARLSPLSSQAQPTDLHPGSPIEGGPASTGHGGDSLVHAGSCCMDRTSRTGRGKRNDEQLDRR